MRSSMVQDPIVSLSHLSDMAAGKPQEMRKLAHMYVQATEDSLTTLRRAVNIGNINQIERTAHAAAGASSLIGVIGMFSLLKHIEHLGETKDLKGVRQVLPDLEKMFQRVKEFFAAQSKKAPAFR
jgi:HPt (histidine-containing phosphotransfer) domain-containing protein